MQSRIYWYKAICVTYSARKYKETLHIIRRSSRRSMQCGVLHLHVVLYNHDQTQFVWPDVKRTSDRHNTILQYGLNLKSKSYRPIKLWRVVKHLCYKCRPEQKAEIFLHFTHWSKCIIISKCNDGSDDHDDNSDNVITARQLQRNHSVIF